MPKLRSDILVPLVVLTVLLALSARGTRASDATLEALEERAFHQAAALSSASIVRIRTVGGVDRVGRVLVGNGPTTGVVVSSDGYVISSAFNFISNPSSILIELPDGRRFAARNVATDRSKMITLLKIDVVDLKPAVAAPRDSVRVGQWALAMGRTYGDVQPSISVGIVSALNRIWGRAIQTDAKVSPVNYGGPLVDIEGRTMGILVPLSAQKSGESAGVEWYDSGIGFAIPMHDVLAAVERLKSGNDLHAGLLGVVLKGGPLAERAVIDRVRVASPAYDAGLKPGDHIVEANGRAVTRQAEFKKVLGRLYADDVVALKVSRDDKLVDIRLTLAAELKPYESGFLGILPRRDATEQATEPGVEIRYVYADGPAALAGLKRRDRVIKLDGQDVNDSDALADLVSRNRPGETVTLTYRREGAETSADVELAALPDTIPNRLPSAVVAPREGGEAADEEAELKTGRFTVEMPSHEHSYWAYVPDDYNPENEYGLMVWIHPVGDTMEPTVARGWTSICSHRGLIIVAPKSARVGGWELSEAEFAKAAIEEMADRYTIDPKRVFLHSYSEGGGFAFHLAFKYRDLFRGIAVAAAPLTFRPPENEPGRPLHFHLVCGERDALSRAVMSSKKLLSNAKYPASLTIVPGQDRKYPHADQLEEIGRWADCLDRI